jgi:hypothetical protein
MRRLLLLAVCLTGCASAQIGGNNGDDDQPDAGDDDDDGNIDAAPDIDAPVTVNLVQTGATNVVPTQIGCQQTNPLTNFTTENSYYRTFPISEAGITVPFNITEIQFAVERSTPGGGAATQPAEIRLGRYSGTVNAPSFALASLQQLAVAAIQIPVNATTVTTPISAFTPNTLTLQPADVLYVELFIPDGRGAGNIFYIGSNAGTETHPSYIRANDCGTAAPTSYDTVVGDPAIRLILSVTGTR